MTKQTKIKYYTTTELLYTNTIYKWNKMDSQRENTINKLR